MERISTDAKRYRVLIDTLATEGRVFNRGDVLSAEDAPGEIESLLHAGVIETTEPRGAKADRNLF